MRLCCSEGKDSRVRIGYRVQRKSDRLAAVVESKRYALVSTQSSQVAYMAIPPEDCIDLGIAGERVDCSVCCPSNDQAALIDPLGAAASATRKRAEAAQDAVLPLERVLNIRIQPTGVVGLEEIWVLWVIRIESGDICTSSDHSLIV